MTQDKPLGPPPVEPLSDTAWSRIERGVWSELEAEVPARPARRARRARRWWLATGALAFAAAIAALVIGLGARSAPLAVSDEPSRVVSGAAPSAVSFGDAHITLDAGTALVLSHEDGHPVVLIERGAAWFTVAPRAGRPEFIVRAGDAGVRVVGTRFRVARSDEEIAVTVEHGVVDVRFRGAITTVGARQHWSSASPAHATAIARSSDPGLAPAAAAPTRAPVPELASALAAPAPDPVATARAPDPVPVGIPTPAAHPHRPPATAPPTLPTSRANADRTEYDRLAALEPADPGAALLGYLTLAGRAGPWADPALFAAARLAADHGDRRAGLLLERYLRRWPSGANAADAQRLLARLKGSPP